MLLLVTVCLSCVCQTVRSSVSRRVRCSAPTILRQSTALRRLGVHRTRGALCDHVVACAIASAAYGRSQVARAALSERTKSSAHVVRALHGVVRQRTPSHCTLARERPLSSSAWWVRQRARDSRSVGRCGRSAAWPCLIDHRARRPRGIPITRSRQREVGLRAHYRTERLLHAPSSGQLPRHHGLPPPFRAPFRDPERARPR